MSVVATEAYPDCAFISKHEIELVDFDTLLARSDVVSGPLPPYRYGLGACSTGGRLRG